MFLLACRSPGPKEVESGGVGYLNGLMDSCFHGLHAQRADAFADVMIAQR